MSDFIKNTKVQDAMGVIPEELLEQELNRIDAAAEKGASLPVLENMVRRVHHGSTLKTANLEDGKVLYRAVRYHEKPWWLRQLGRPPSSIVREMGRVNIAGESVFYSVLGSPVACLDECHAKLGETFAISSWKTTKRMNLHSLGYLSSGVMRHRSAPETQGGWMYPATSRTRERMLCQWQTSVFNRKADSCTYALSNAITKAFLTRPGYSGTYSLNDFHGMLYPSVAAQYLGDNVALTPQFADKNLQFLSCNWVEVNSMKEPGSLAQHDVVWQSLDYCTQLRRADRLLWIREPTAFTYC